MSRSAFLAFLTLALSTPARAPAQDLIAVDYEGSAYLLDSTIGAITTLGPTGMVKFNGMATAPNGTVYAGRTPDPVAPQLVEIDPQTGLGMGTALPTNLDFRGLAARPGGLLFAIIDHSKTASGKDELFVIDPVQLTATSIGSTGRTAIQALARAPDGRLYGWEVSNSGWGLLRIDPLTGMAVDVNPSVGAVVEVQFLAFLDDGTLVGGRHELYVIDTNTGLATQIGPGGYPDLRGADVLPPGFTQCSWAYGSGCPGSGGFVPKLESVGCPTAGGPVQIALTNALGGASGLMLVGLAPAAVPLPGPCTLYVTPVLPLIVPFPLSGVGPGSGSVGLFGTLPAATAGFSFTVQAFVDDSGQSWGFAASNGVRLSPQ